MYSYGIFLHHYTCEGVYMKLTENHFTRPLKSALLVEYRCDCGKGFYRVAQDEPRIQKHNQIPHKCTVCGKLVYFTAPYPLVRVKDESFVHWETLRGERLSDKEEAAL